MNLSRIMHSVAVANKLQTMTESYGGDGQSAWLLGILHDVGHEFSDPSNHAEVGGMLLEREGFRFWREVYYHGQPDPSYQSTELDMLNYADMTTGPNGENMTFAERLADIERRYRADSSQAEDFRKLMGRMERSAPAP